MTILAAHKRPLDLEAEIMTLGEVAAYLRCAPSTIYRLLKNGKLVGRKVGRDYRFNRQALDAWVIQQEKVSKTAVYAPRVKR